MRKIVIFGAGGFGREIQWLIERINEEKYTWEIAGYIDDNVEIGTEIDGYQVLGGSKYLVNYPEVLAVALAVGNAGIRKSIIEKISVNEKLEFPNLIDPSVQMSQRIIMGKGNLICVANILTVDIWMGDFNIINLDCTVGHDVKLESYITVYPSVNISGCVSIGDLSEIGTGTQIIQGKTIGSRIIVGAGSCVVRDLQKPGTYVGIPARQIK